VTLTSRFGVSSRMTGCKGRRERREERTRGRCHHTNRHARP
jgi:hypothetical protein